MGRTWRWWSIGSEFTKPFVGLGSVSVTTACASRWSYAARVAPKRAPASIRGAPCPYGIGRVWWIEPSFFGYPWWRPRAIAKSVVTQISTQRE